jgi:hypothetical protein
VKIVVRREALIDGTPLEGHWFDHTREYAARNQREEITRLQFATEESVILSPIPCWAHLPPEIYRERIASLVKDIETDAALVRNLNGLSVLGAEAILAMDPQHRPAHLDRSPAPLVHAATQATRKAFYKAYAWFVAAFRQPPRNCGREIAMWSSRPAASRRPCRSYRDSPQPALFASLTARQRVILPISCSSLNIGVSVEPVCSPKKTRRTRIRQLRVAPKRSTPANSSRPTC